MRATGAGSGQAEGLSGEAACAARGRAGDSWRTCMSWVNPVLGRIRELGHGYSGS